MATAQTRLSNKDHFILLQPGGILGLQAKSNPAIFLSRPFPGEAEVVRGGVSITMEPLHRTGVKEGMPTTGLKKPVHCPDR